MKYKSLFTPISFISFTSLVVILLVLNSLIFKNQLNYGFRDVDWSLLYHYKLFGKLSFNHLIESFSLMGAYTYEIYYVGFLEKIFGLNFTLLHQTTQIFKIISAVCLYFLMLHVFKRRLLAFLSSLIYTISYTHAGALFMLATGGYFFASIFMILLFLCYYYAIISKNNLVWLLISSGLLFLTLALNTERMYPLLLFLPIIEFIYIYINRWKRSVIKLSIKRVFIIFLPVILFILVYIFFLKRSIVNTGFAPNQFFVGLEMRLDSIVQGNWQLLFYPFASLGSIFLFGDFWKILGTPDFKSFSSYLFFLTSGPILRIGLITFVLSSVVYKKSLKPTMFITLGIFVFGLLFYAVYMNWQKMDSSMRIHFDPNLSILPTIWGVYVFILSLFLFIIWIKNRDKNLLPLILGMFFSVLFTFLTWVASDIQLLFMGPQRYLSIPSIGISLFIAGILVIIFDRIRAIKSVKNLAWMFFLVLIPIVYINWQVASKFFNYELTYAGLRGNDQIRMQNKFRQLVGKISQNEMSLFYFDETADKNNGYFDESTVMAGFEFWTRVNMDGSLNNFPEPGMMRTNAQCPLHTHSNCIEILRKGLNIVDGEKGFWYKDVIRGKGYIFYKKNNLYAIRFINSQLVNIKDEVLRELESK